MENARIGDRYVDLEFIGSGGEARVFRARDENTGREVAVRLAHEPALSKPLHNLPTFDARWVQMLDCGEDPVYGTYYIFELLTGQTLERVIENGPLDPESWLLLVHESLDAVIALHQSGWVHGDLNSGNIFRTAITWKLLELPFLRFDPPPGRSAMFGSIYTMAPEQLNNRHTDGLSDLYSLGCLYYYAACGEYPHAASSSSAIAIDRLQFPAEPLEEKAPRLPIPWTRWVMTLLERDPQKRFHSAATARQLLKTA